MGVLGQKGGLGDFTHVLEGVDHEVDHQLPDYVGAAEKGLEFMELLQDKGRDVVHVEIAAPESWSHHHALRNRMHRDKLAILAHLWG